MTKLHLFVATNSHPVFSQAIGFTLFKSSSVLKTMRRPSRVKPKTCEWKEKMLSGFLALWIHSLPTLLAVTFLFTWMHQRFISNETITCLASFKQIPQEIKKKKVFLPSQISFSLSPSLHICIYGWIFNFFLHDFKTSLSTGWKGVVIKKKDEKAHLVSN